MSVVVTIAAYSPQDQKTMLVVAGSMRDAFGTNQGSRFAGIIGSTGLRTADHHRPRRPLTGPDYFATSSAQ